MNEVAIVFIFSVLALFLAIDSIRRSIGVFNLADKAREEERALRRLTRSKQPHASVLVYGDKKGENTKRTMASVSRSRYYAYDTVIAHSRMIPTRAYRAAYRRSQHGEVIVCLQAGEIIDPLFLKRAVLARKNKARWWVVVKDQSQQNGLVGITRTIQKALWGDIHSIEVCTAKALRHSEPIVRRIKGIPFIVAGLLVVGVVLAVMYGGLMVLWYAWVIFTLYLLTVIWISETITRKERLRASFALPSAFFLFPVASLLEGVFQLAARK